MEDLQVGGRNTLVVELLEEETLDNEESQSKRSGNCLDLS